MLEPGTPAPPFTLPDHRGEPRSLQDYAGQWLVLWWYPRACSEVCSIQGRSLAPATPALRELGANVLGVSFDTQEENVRFAAQEGLDFPLLSDLDKQVGTAYRVVRNPDEPFADAPRRITYLIDPGGVIRRSYLVTDVATHPEQMLADLRELTGRTGQEEGQVTQ